MRPEKNAVEIQRWDRREAQRTFRLDDVGSRLDEFHDFLYTSPPEPNASAIAHALRAFRHVRAVAATTTEKGTDSLRVFLLLLASAAGERRNPQHSDVGSWGLDEQALDAARELSESSWHALLEVLQQGPVGTALNLDVDLLIRHAAGVLFQEAHYEMLVGSQLMLDGFLPLPARVIPSPSRMGLHFTPPALVRAIVQKAVDQLPLGSSLITLFDPACGSGEFLREGLRELRRRGFTGPVKLIGWDISEAAYIMTRFALAAGQRDDLGDVLFEVHHTDAMSDASTWPQGVDAVLMNPPFIALDDQTPELRSVIRQVLGSLVRQRPDVAAAFWWKATSAVRSGGVVATILPASLLDGSSVETLREAIGERMEPCLIGRLGNQDLFASARVDAGLYVGRRSGASDSPAMPTQLALWVDHRGSSYNSALRALRRARPEDLPVTRPGFSLYVDPLLGRSSESWAPRPYGARLLAASLAGIPTVGTLFHVHQGVRSGDTSTFLLSQTDWEELPRKEQRYFRPAVTNSAIDDGQLLRQHYLFYPYGELAIASDTDLRSRVPTYYRYWLLPAKPKLVARKRFGEERWWHLSEYRPWQRERRPKLVSAYFGEEGSFTYDGGGDFVVVQGFAWISRRAPSTDASPHSIPVHAYVALLNTRLFFKLVAAHSNHVGGGQWNLSSKFVTRIPLPNLTSPEMPADVISGLSTLGHAITNAGLHQLGARITELDELSYAAYRLTPDQSAYLTALD